MKNTLEPFELKVMGLALRGHDDWVAGMRDQLSHLTVSTRQATGGGFITNFHCNGSAVPVRVPRGEDGLPVRGYPPTINAKRREPTEGLVSFIVWLGQDGRIQQLEACSLTEDQWPEDLFSGFHSFQDDMGNIVEQ